MFLALSLIFFVWIARELIDWYKIMDKTERKFVFSLLALGLLFLLISGDVTSTLISYGFFFSIWIVHKAYQRVIKLEPRRSDFRKLKTFIKEEERVEAMIAKAKAEATHEAFMNEFKIDKYIRRNEDS